MAMHLKALFVQRKIVKKYWIITSGVPDPVEGNVYILFQCYFKCV